MKDFRKEYEEKGAYHTYAKGFFSWWLEDNYKLLARHVRKGEVVLDLACGEGVLSQYLPECTLIGLDNVEKSLEFNRSLYPGAYKELILGDIRSLDDSGFARGKFDKIICSLSLMYLLPKELEVCLGRLHKILRVGGEFIFSYPSIHKKRRSNPEASELTLNALKDLLIGAGFEIRQFSVICPLQPKIIVWLSEKPIARFFAKLYYRLSKKIFNDFDHSYHFVLEAIRK